MHVRLNLAPNVIYLFSEIILFLYRGYLTRFFINTFRDNFFFYCGFSINFIMLWIIINISNDLEFIENLKKLDIVFTYIFTTQCFVIVIRFFIYTIRKIGVMHFVLHCIIFICTHYSDTMKH